MFRLRKLPEEGNFTRKGVFLQLTGIGGMILIAGFLAFNGGSTGSMSKPGDQFVIARVIINTILGGSGGSIVMLGMCKLGFGGKSAWSFSLTLNAALAGMVRTRRTLQDTGSCFLYF
jgi:Amt family ammonium transporter